jgi:hypothetical protein
MDKYNDAVDSLVALVGDIYSDVPYRILQSKCREYFDRAYTDVSIFFNNAEKANDKPKS